MSVSVKENEKLLNEIRCAIFKAIREYTGLSQAKFSQKYCLNEKTVKNWEQEVCSPTSAYLYLLARCVAQDEGIIGIVSSHGDHGVDYVLTNGTKLYNKDWNGEVYSTDKIGESNRYIYKPIDIPISYDDGEPDEWERIGFEQLY